MGVFLNVLTFLFIKCVCCDFKYFFKFHSFLLFMGCELPCDEIKMCTALHFTCKVSSHFPHRVWKSNEEDPREVHGWNAMMMMMMMMMMMVMTASKVTVKTKVFCVLECQWSKPPSLPSPPLSISPFSFFSHPFLALLPKGPGGAL